MMLPEETKQLCLLFAIVLDYPEKSLPEAVTQCVRSLEHSFPESAEPMRRFATFACSQNLGQLEELYIHSFDISPATTPYLGYHLFGEGPKRSAFMVKLQEAYQAHHFSAGMEMPDHLCVLLRFLGVAQDAEFVIPLLQECLLPVLRKMERSLPENGNGYAPAVNSLKLFLQQVQRRLVKAGGMTHG